ncbi:hypothetical protein HDU89_000947 [Geranomyces variabilis]|nr:hypothetical protein HDU89_000947 [Geranomyces variabilis]
MASVQQHLTAIKDLRDCNLAQLLGQDNDELFTEERLSGIFGAKRSHQEVIFSVPIYQRRYCWTPHMVTRLLVDIAEAFRENAPYYPIGTIVLAPERNTDRQLDIVDGQQRLTTLMLLLCVFRHFAPSNEKQEYTTWLTSAVHKDHFKYRLNLPSPYHQAFCHYFLDRDDLEEHLGEDCELAVPDQDARPIVALLSENVRQSVEILSKMDAQSRKTLAHYLFRQCRLLVIYTHDVDSAFRIFTSLNVPGIPLTPVDYLKAVTFGRLRNTVRDGYDQKVRLWIGAERRLRNANFGELIDHLYRIELAGRNERANFQSSFSASLGNTNSSFHRFMFETLDATALINKVNTYSRTWFSIMECRGTDFAPVQGNKSRLHLKTAIDTGTIWRTWLTVALAAGHSNSILLGEKEFWNRLEKLIAVLFVRHKQIGKKADVVKKDLIDRFFDVLMKVVAAGDNKQKVFDAITPTAQEIKEWLVRINGNLYNGAGILATRYLLRRINAEMCDTKVAFDWEHVHIEHIFPQNPGKAWEGIDFKKNTNRLGNLCLLPASTNIQCSNAPWSIKRAIYTENRKGEMVPFVLTTKTLLDAGTIWSCQEFEKRHGKLLEQIKKIYDVAVPQKITTAGINNLDEIEDDEEEEAGANAIKPDDLSNMTEADKYVPQACFGSKLTDDESDDESEDESDDENDDNKVDGKEDQKRDGRDAGDKKRVHIADKADEKSKPLKKKQKLVAGHLGDPNPGPVTLTVQPQICGKVCSECTGVVCPIMDLCRFGD